MTSRLVEGDPAVKADPPAKIVTKLFDRVTDVALGKRPPNPEDVAEIRGLDPEFGRPFVSGDRMIYRVMHALEGGKVRLEPILDAASGVDPASALAEAAAYLAFQGAACRYLRERKLDRTDAQELAGEVDSLLAILDRIATERPAIGAHLANRAKLESLRDRDAAGALLAQARDAAPEFMARLRYDYGSSTYLTAAEVAGPGPAYPADIGRAELKQALAARSGAFADAGTNLVWSSDVRFFRIHGPPWFEVLPYLMRCGIRPVCVMIGEADEAQAAIDEARGLIAGIARYRGDPDPEGVARSVVFVRVAVPAFVADPRTFYACARFLHARQIIEESGAPAVVMDIDMTVKDPFAPFLAALAGVDVAVPFTRGLAAFSPWRRYMAGTDWFAATPASLAFLETVERYIVRGLDREASWMLDQNALSFAIESGVGGATVSNLNLTRRPAGQDELRKQYERQF